MTTIPFVHLHNHSTGSAQDGFAKPEDMAKAAKALGHSAIACTDHGTLTSSIAFYQACKKEGVKPILGMEAYVTVQSSTITGKANPNHHLLLLARNQTGWQNLLKLATIAGTEERTFNRRSRIDHGLLEQYGDGLIVTSACLGGEICKLLEGGDYAAARERASWYKSRFGPWYNLEIQYHPLIPQQGEANIQLARLSAELNIPLMVTTDAHMAHEEDDYGHKLTAAMGMNMNLDAYCNFPGTLDPYKWLCPADRLWDGLKQFGYRPFERTVELADACNVQLKFDNVTLPHFPIPDGFTSQSYLEYVSQEGLKEVFGSESVPDSYWERLAYELDVIGQTGFPDYMLIVWDMVRFARSHNIFCLPRGSAGASLVLYALRITDVDPVANTLLFERFLSPERLEMPDIDTDFQDDKRSLIFDYLVEKYGRDKTAQIATVGRYRAKNSISGVGMTLGIPISVTESLVRKVPKIPASITLKEAYEKSEEFRAAVESSEQTRQLYEGALLIEGRDKSEGTHACGVVISRDPLTNLVPILPTKNGGLMAGFEGQWLAKLGLLKLDILGLQALSALNACLNMVSEQLGRPFTLADIPLNDKATFDLLSSGDTATVFQLESDGMTRYLTQLKPTRVGDLYALVALYRPGPLEQIPHYIEGKAKPKSVTYLHPILKPILEDTYGVIVYQEQIMTILREVAGYTLGEAYSVIKAISKKKKDEMAAHEVKFVQGAIDRTIPEHTAKELWRLIQPFAGYSFNRPHSTLYGLLSYRTAWLKTHYPAEWLTAHMAAKSGDTKVAVKCCAEARRRGVIVLPPDVNVSQKTFTVSRQEDGTPVIRFGLQAINGVGVTALDQLISERVANGPYTHMRNLIVRQAGSSVNRKVIESLIKAGALDSFGSRHAQLAALDDVIEGKKKAREKLKRQQAKAAKAATKMQVTLLDEGMFITPAAAEPEVLPQDEPFELPQIIEGEAERQERLAWEKEKIGQYISAHPIDEAIRRLNIKPSRNWLELDALENLQVGQTVVGIALAEKVKEIKTGKGAMMLKIKLMDTTGECEGTLFPRIYAMSPNGFWSLGDQLIWYRGKINEYGGRLGIVVEEFSDDLTTIPKAKPLLPKLELEELPAEDTHEAEPEDEAQPPLVLWCKEVISDRLLERIAQVLEFECPRENRQLYLSLLVQYDDSEYGQTTKRVLMTLEPTRFGRGIPDDVAAKFAKGGIEIRDTAASMAINPLYSL